MTNISQSFTYKMAAKINRNRYGTIFTSLSLYVLFTGKKITTGLPAREHGERCKLPLRVWVQPGRQTLSSAL